MSGICFAVVKQEHGEVEGDAGVVQFLRREFLQDRDSIGGSTLRIQRKRLGNYAGWLGRRLIEGLFGNALTFAGVAIEDHG